MPIWKMVHMNIIFTFLIIFNSGLSIETLLPVSKSKTRQDFVGGNPQNPWEQFRTSRLMVPSYRVNLGSKTHQQVRNKRNENLVIHGVDSNDLEDQISKHMYYANSNLFSDDFGF